MEHTISLDNYPGIAIRYDPQTTPWFQLTVTEALDKINSVDIGKQLLDLIAKADPKNRIRQSDNLPFPEGINVIIYPAENRKFIQAGYKAAYLPGTDIKGGMAPSAHPLHNIHGHDFNYAGDGSANCNQDPFGPNAKPYSRDGSGTVCRVSFDSSQLMTRKGEHTTPFIVLAHELIHSYHGLYGIHKGSDEEKWTTGIGDFADEPMSENGFRNAFQMDERESY